MTSTPFDELDDYLELPRVTGLAASADGARVVVAVARLNEKRSHHVGALWELDPAGRLPARRLTRSADGESAPTFTSHGDVLFLSRRSHPGDGSTPPPSLWRLPAGGGEADHIADTPGGISGVRAASDADLIVVASALLPAARDVDDDRRLRDTRKDGEVTAVLHTGYPVRFWNADLGPGQTRLLDVDGLRDLTPEPGNALLEAGFVLSPDGSFLITTWRKDGPGPTQRSVLVRIEVASGHSSVIADDPDASFEQPVISPDGTAVAFTRDTISTPERAPRMTLQVLLFGGERRTLAGDWHLRPSSLTWSHDSTTLLVTADENGRAPVFTVEVATSAITRLTDDDFCYTDLAAAPEGVVFALRSSYAAPPHPVRIDRDGTVTALPCVEIPTVPGTLTELTTTTADGVDVRSWLVLPDAESPAPLLLWVHGGPLGSWNSWTWRWNPWLMAARGYAVLLPDPALSTGYGQDFIQRGWGAWGGPPFDDLMAATNAACAHPRIDASRTAAMGGSFGGYMANWIAGHTDRFSAIVTHASLWALDQFGATTDTAYYWRREMTAEMAAANSPHHFVGAISTPMLVIHGDKDYRVPIGEGLRLWYELLAHSALPAGEDGSSPHRFLYYPNEDHWVIGPQNAKVWYETVFAFLAEHVLGQRVEWPEALGVASRL